MAREGADWVEKEDNFIFKKLKEGKEVKEFFAQLKRKEESVQARMEELFTNLHEEKTIDDLAEELGIDRAKIVEILGKDDAEDGEAEEAEAEVDAGGEEEAEAEAAPPAKPAAAGSKAKPKADEVKVETKVTVPAKAEPAKKDSPKETKPKAEAPAKEVKDAKEHKAETHSMDLTKLVEALVASNEANHRVMQEVQKLLAKK